MLDMGETRRAWGVALLCHWAIIWMILIRRPLLPTRLDLAFVRYAMLPLIVLIVAIGPSILKLVGILVGSAS